MSARIPDHAGRPVSTPLLIAFGEQRAWYLYVVDGAAWVSTPDRTEWRRLDDGTTLPGLGGEVLTGGKRAAKLAELGEPRD